MTDPAARRTGARVVAIVGALALAITVTLAAYVYAGAPYAVMALVTWSVSIAGWLSSSRHPGSVIPTAFNLLIGALVALMALYSEEWYRQFPSAVMHYFPASYPAGVGMSEHAFVAVFPLTASAILIVGALAYYRRAALGELAAWTIFSWACVASLAVYAVAPLAGQPMHYVGGMVTAPIPFSVGVLGIARLVRPSARKWT